MSSLVVMVDQEVKYCHFSFNDIFGPKANN